MRRTIITSILFALITVCSAQTLTQEVNSNGGGNYSQINASLQFTIGEPIIETYSTSTGRLYQGFEQGNYNIVSIEEPVIDTAISVALYPNPSTGIFSLNLKSNLPQYFILKIVDMHGKLILEKQFSAESTETINLSEYNNSIYFIIINSTETSYTKTYKILKQ